MQSEPQRSPSSIPSDRKNTQKARKRELLFLIYPLRDSSSNCVIFDYYPFCFIKPKKHPARDLTDLKMAASIYRGSSPSRFQFAGPTHYTSTVVDSAPMPMQLRYNSFAIDGHQVPLPSTPPTRGNNSNNNNGMPSNLNLATPPPGATLGLLNGNHAMGKPLFMQHHHQQHHHPASSANQRHSSPIYSSAPSPLFINPMLAKSYQQHMERQMTMAQPTELLMVSPGMPTPLELSIYENKQPTGFLHVTVGNQTVEFLDGVANMPRKR